MLLFKRFLFFVVVLALCSACNNTSGVVPEYAIPAKPRVWQVGFTPGTQWMYSLLPKCANRFPDMVLLPNTVSGPYGSIEGLDFAFVWGASFVDEHHPDTILVWQEEELAVIVHPDVPIRTLTREELIRVFSENPMNWVDLDPASSFSCEINVLGYPEGSEIRLSMESVVGVLSNGGLSIVDGPEAMLAAIGDIPCSIGVVPKTLLDGKAARVAVDGLDFVFPILVVSDGELPDEIQQWLGCLRPEG